MTTNTNVNNANYWFNSDNLRVKFPGTSDAVGLGGEFAGAKTNQKCVEFIVGYANAALGTDATHEFILDYDVVLPINAFLEKAEFLVTSAWDSASNDVTLNFGLIQQSDFSTVYSSTGVFAAIARSATNDLGARIEAYPTGSLPAASTYVGASIGTKLTQNCVVTVWWGNHVPTQGAGLLRVYYAMPSVDVGA